MASWGKFTTGILLCIACSFVTFSKNVHGIHQASQSQSECLDLVLNNLLLETNELNQNGLSEISDFQLRARQERDACSPTALPSCDPSNVYRTLNGDCNNLATNPSWGSAKSPYRRILPPEYTPASTFGPRGGDPTALPEPRLIRTTIHDDVDNPDPNLSTMVMTFGQFIAHDLILSGGNPTLIPNPPDCCSTERPLAERCFPLRIPPNDPFYSAHGVDCKNLSRTAGCIDSHADWQQRNEQSSFLDGCSIYGIDLKVSMELRTLQNGLLLTDADDFPLPSEGNADRYLMGDFRANQNPAFSALHIVWIREHNRIAKGLFAKHPEWDDEELFQKSRRILIAELQTVAYNEYLRVLFPNCVYENFELNVGAFEYSSYNSRLDPTRAAEMSGAVFRMGHSMINGLQLLVKDGEILGSYRFRDTFLLPKKIIVNNTVLEQILEGLPYNANQKVDRHVSDDVGNFLFKPPALLHGSDLISSNLQRGRDHGIPNYNAVRDYCFLPKLQFDDPSTPDTIDAEAWTKIKSVYSSADDIDLWTGGVSEIPLSGGIIGPTFACILAGEFYRMKFGDRFFFTHKGEVGSFEPEQLENLAQRRLFDIFCDNTNISRLPLSLFHLPKETNPEVSCGERNLINFDLF